MLRVFALMLRALLLPGRDTNWAGREYVTSPNFSACCP